MLRSLVNFRFLPRGLNFIVNTPTFCRGARTLATDFKGEILIAYHWRIPMRRRVEFLKEAIAAHLAYEQTRNALHQLAKENKAESLDWHEAFSR